MTRVVLAMSGGVDSSVAAWLLQQQGHEVIGLFMRHGVAETACGATRGRSCCSAADADDARGVAGRLGIPFYSLDFEAEFERIIDYFVDEYSKGRTPNPCVVCNTWLKFGRLAAYADRLGAERIATGHYARLESEAIYRGLDASKDQSYVLFGIQRPLLARLALPVGHYTKADIRRIAAELKLPVADKPDSQEICFVPDDDHARLVRERRPGEDRSGELVTTEGEVVGRHDGIERFTVGQRKGLGVALGGRRYVVQIEPETRRVVLGRHEDLARRGLVFAEANWLADEPRGPLECQVKIRYRSPAAAAQVEPLGAGRFLVRFMEPRHGVAPGQAAVCYQGDRMLGGGWIE